MITDEQLLSIPPRQVYEWVKTGVWDLKQFQRWVYLIRE